MPKVCLKKETFEKNRAEPLPKAAVAPEKTAANGFFFLAVSNLRHFSSLKSQTWRFCSLKPHIWQSSSANPHPQFDSFDSLSISPFQSSSKETNHRNCLFASLPGAGGKTFSYVEGDVTSCERRLLCKPRLGVLELCLPNLLSIETYDLHWFDLPLINIDHTNHTPLHRVFKIGKLNKSYWSSPQAETARRLSNTIKHYQTAKQ